jgi:hypothetical protein
MPLQTRASMISWIACVKRSKLLGGQGAGEHLLLSAVKAILSVPKNASSACVHGRAAEAAVPCWMVGKAGRDERRPGDRDGRVEERQPGRVGLGRRVAVRGCLADRRDRAPEVPVVLVVPAADDAVGRGQVRHRIEAGALDDVETSGRGQRPEDAVPDGGPAACQKIEAAVWSAVRFVPVSEPTFFTSLKSFAWAVLPSALWLTAVFPHGEWVAWGG